MAGQPVILIFGSPEQLVDKAGDYTLYVGKLKADTSVKKIRAHLRDIGVSHVSDVLKLPCKTIGQASFCISVAQQLTRTSYSIPRNGQKVCGSDRMTKEQEKLKDKVHQEIDAM